MVPPACPQRRQTTPHEPCASALAPWVRQAGVIRVDAAVTVRVGASAYSPA